MNDIYHRLADVYKMACIDRDLFQNGKLIAERLEMIPILESDQQMGAAILLGILAFPDNIKKSNQFTNYANAEIIKKYDKLNNSDRVTYQQFISIPNKRINQFLGNGKKGAGYRLNLRLRAAYTMCRKYISSIDDPSLQCSLNEIVSEDAILNSSVFPAFISSEDNPGESYIKRVLWSSKSVMHIAMALYLQLNQINMKEVSVMSLIMNADKWLSETVFLAELIRVEFGSWFPRKNSQYLNVKDKNFTIELSKTIALWPIIDEINI